mmetsp:Transcript_15903/g.44577  ORF Transcript_15903/g.44577 Transcript_15903/m.44577 type:complete len:222 (+) Transcript_15903:297-962(+)
MLIVFVRIMASAQQKGRANVAAAYQTNQCAQRDTSLRTAGQFVAAATAIILCVGRFLRESWFRSWNASRSREWRRGKHITKRRLGGRTGRPEARRTARLQIRRCRAHRRRTTLQQIGIGPTNAFVIAIGGTAGRDGAGKSPDRSAAIGRRAVAWFEPCHASFRILCAKWLPDHGRILLAILAGFLGCATRVWRIAFAVVEGAAAFLNGWRQETVCWLSGGK